MKKNFKFITNYWIDGKSISYEGLSNKDFTLKVNEGDDVLKVEFIPNGKITNLNIIMQCDHDFIDTTKIFVNGYQSWTDSREFTRDEKLPRIKGLGKLVSGIKMYGDELFVKYPNTNGVFHAYTYGYTRDDKKVCLFGSLTEKNGYTIITFDSINNNVKITKDLDGVIVENPINVFELAYIEGDYESAFDKYFELQELPPLKTKRTTGYTSWYNYYTNLKSSDVVNDLNSFKEKNVKIDLFQIDDGYQTQVGDWLSLKPDFEDMKSIVDQIHQNNIKAGLWLAPFACTTKSRIFKEHKDWLIKDDNGKFVSGVMNWGGNFYILDYLNKDVQNYLKEVFDVVLNKWGYDMVKLDFLYVACITPRQNKSRGQLMCEALDFIRECVGNKLILGCGVPLGPAFGKVDFCRIGCDVGLRWKETFIEKCLHRERVSVINTLNCTIFRRHLNGRAFVNDPDVFFLRDYNLKLNDEQKTIIAKVNKLFGGVLFVSDNINTYSQETLKKLQEVYNDDDIKIVSAEYKQKNIIEIEYIKNGGNIEKFIFDINLGKIL